MGSYVWTRWSGEIAAWGPHGGARKNRHRGLLFTCGAASHAKDGGVRYFGWPQRRPSAGNALLTNKQKGTVISIHYTNGKLLLQIYNDTFGVAWALALTAASAKEPYLTLWEEPFSGK
jgi:hypothetical protein